MSQAESLEEDRASIGGLSRSLPPAGIGSGLRLAALALLTVWMVIVLRTAERPVLAMVFGLGAVASLLVQRRAPVVPLVSAFGGVLLAAGMAGFEGPDDPFLVLIIWASYGVGRYLRLRHQPWGAAGTLFFLSLNVLGEDQLALPAELVFPVLFTAAPWLLGLAMQVAGDRERHAFQLARRAVASQEDEVRRAAAEERLRLARELHDVAAHSMSVVSLHAQVLRRRVESGIPIGAEDAKLIETAAQQALSELRRVVGALRPADDAAAMAPQPQFDELSHLLDTCREAGQDIDLTISGSPRALPPGLSLTAYRIVQEALSNARRHGALGRVQLQVDWDDVGVRLRITNPARRSGQHRRGHGLIGMSERAALYDGTCSTGPAGAGQWTVDAWLPDRAMTPLRP